MKKPNSADASFPFTTATGERFVAGMAVDITEQKKAEEVLHRLPQSILEAQEQERRRVARELHDSVNQAIASAKFRIQTAENQICGAIRNGRNPAANRRKCWISFCSRFGGFRITFGRANWTILAWSRRRVPRSGNSRIATGVAVHFSGARVR